MDNHEEIIFHKDINRSIGDKIITKKAIRYLNRIMNDIFLRLTHMVNITNQTEIYNRIRQNYVSTDLSYGDLILYIKNSLDNRGSNLSFSVKKLNRIINLSEFNLIILASTLDFFCKVLTSTNEQRILITDIVDIINNNEFLLILFHNIPTKTHNNDEMEL